MATSGIGAETTTCQPSMPGQPDGRPAVRVVGGHGREVEHLAGQGAGVERALGLGDDRARGIGHPEDATGHLDRRRRDGEQGRHRDAP